MEAWDRGEGPVCRHQGLEAMATGNGREHRVERADPRVLLEELEADAEVLLTGNHQRLQETCVVSRQRGRV